MSRPTELARQVETLNDVEWYDFLDEIDKIARLRRHNIAAEPDGADRGVAAAWLAQQDFIFNNTVREIWYLPAGSPENEIRFIEVNDRFSGDRLNPFDSRADVGTSHYKWRVLDATSDELELIKQDPSRLPPGWAMDGSIVWRRGE